MTEEETLGKIFELVKEVKKAYPDLRIGQIFYNIAELEINPDKLFTMSDEEIINALQNYLDLARIFADGSITFSNI